MFTERIFWILLTCRHHQHRQQCRSSSAPILLLVEDQMEHERGICVHNSILSKNQLLGDIVASRAAQHRGKLSSSQTPTATDWTELGPERARCCLVNGDTEAWSQPGRGNRCWSEISSVIVFKSLKGLSLNDTNNNEKGGSC